jgi:hypothetical protein
MSAELFANLSAVVVGLGVGVPILVKGLRLGDKPAIYLGLAVSLEGLEWLLWGISLYTPLAGTPLGEAFAIGCRIGITAMATAMLLFTREVFRSDSQLATTLCGVMVIAMLVGFFGSGSLGDWAGYRSDNPWVWIENLAQLGVFAWAFAEPLGFYRKMRKRAQFGLGDPVVANRILLWSIYGAGFTLSQILWVTVLSVYEDLTTLDVLIVGTAMAGEIAVWLAFFPPKWYEAWIRGQAAESATGA